MAVIGSLTTIRTQLVRHPRFDVAFTYLDELAKPGSPLNQRLAALSPGDSKRVDLSLGVFSMEQCYNTKPRSAGKLESHVQYIDIQVVVSGEEYMILNDVKHLCLTEDLTPEKDLLFYKDSPAASALRFIAGEAAVYFPADGHMPGIVIKDPALVRKVVVKVPVLA